MSIEYKHKRTSTSDKRPTAAQLSVGEIALNYAAGTAGLFIEDSGGNVIKVGPTEVSGTAPNSSPAGSSGNSTGEMWLDTSSTPAILKVWTGSAWSETNGNASTLDGPVYFTAQANGALALGDVVYISGASGDTPIVTKAQANSASTMPAYGFASEAISSGSTGKITTFGSLEGDGSNPLDTSGLTVNDVVYVSAATAGEWTTTKPTGESNLVQNIGRVQRINANNGVIKVGGAGRASATPNLDSGNIFIGDSNNESSTASFGATMVAALATQSVIITPGSATFGGDVTVSNGEEFRMAELTTNGTNYIAFKAPDAVTTTTTYELPDGDGTSGQVMQTDGSQTLSWVDAGVAGISSSADATAITIDSSERVGIGTTAPNAKLEIAGDGANSSRVFIGQANDTADGTDLTGYRARGTLASPTALSNGDAIFKLFAQAHDGSAYLAAGNMGWAATDGSGNSSFSLKTRSGSSVGDRLTIDSSGNTNIVGALDVSQGITVGSHILPDTNIAYDLGSATNRFRDIYLSNNTINMGGTTLSVDTESGNLSVGGEDLVKASDPVVTGDVNLSENAEIHFFEEVANGTNYLGFKAPAAVTSTTSFLLPDGDGSANQVLQTNGSGTLQWASITTALNPVFTGSATFSDQSEIRLAEAATNGTDYLSFKAPASLTTTTNFTLPDGDGTNKQVLRTNGSGLLSWSKPLDGITDNSTEVLLTLGSDGNISTGLTSDLDVGEYTFFVDSTNYRCGINTNGPNKALDIYGYDNPDTIACYSFEGSPFAPSVYFIKGRGDNTDQEAIQADDRLGMLRFFGYDGTDELYGGQWWVETEDTSMNTCTYNWKQKLSGTDTLSLKLINTGELETYKGFIADNNTGIKLRETTANGTNHIELKAPASVTADTTLTLPDGDGVSGQAMITDGSGTLSFGGFGINAHASFNATSAGSFDWSTDKVAEGNITSVTRTAQGKFTITFDRDFAGAAYTCVGTAGAADHSGTGAGGRTVNIVSRSAGSVDIVVERADDGANTDDGYIAIMVIGVLS